MIDLTSHPRFLHACRWLYRLKALLRWRDKNAKRMERQRTRFYLQAWCNAAEQLGGCVEDLGADILEISLAEVRTRVWCNFTAIDDPVTLMVARNKPAAYRLLARAGLPVPRHAEFSLSDMQPATRLLEQVKGPCVVKPAKDTGGGLGVTTGVANRRQLTRAAAFASGYTRELLIEEQIAGECFRLLYLDGVLLDAIVRRPPAVAGDGRSSIAELVKRENARRLDLGFAACQFLLHRDSDMLSTLARQGLTMRSVLPEGAKAVVKTVVNENAAHENETVTALLCDDVLRAGAQAAAAVGVRLAGVDIMTGDPSLPLRESGGRIIEVNATPGLYYHYYKQGDKVPVAEHVLRILCGQEVSV